MFIYFSIKKGLGFNLAPFEKAMLYDRSQLSGLLADDNLVTGCTKSNDVVVFVNAGK